MTTDESNVNIPVIDELATAADDNGNDTTTNIVDVVHDDTPISETEEVGKLAPSNPGNDTVSVITESANADGNVVVTNSNNKSEEIELTASFPQKVKVFTDHFCCLSQLVSKI